MSSLRLSPLARRDLDEIWEFTATRWGTAQAEAYIRALDEAMRLVQRNPEIGDDARDVRVGYRRFPVASHVLFYRIKSTGVHVVRVLHKSMDAGRHV